MKPLITLICLLIKCRDRACPCSKGGTIKKHILFSVIWSAIACYCNSFAQHPDWINYTNGQSVQSLADNGNELWIGTSGGLVKLIKTTDSMIFYNKCNSGLLGNSIKTLATDNNGNVWIGTYYGLAKFDGTNWTVYNTFNSDLPDNNVTALAIDSSNTLWIGTRYSGLAKFDGTNGQFITPLIPVCLITVSWLL